MHGTLKRGERLTPGPHYFGTWATCHLGVAERPLGPLPVSPSADQCITQTPLQQASVLPLASEYIFFAVSVLLVLNGVVCKQATTAVLSGI